MVDAGLEVGDPQDGVARARARQPVRSAPAAGPRTVKELGDLGAGFVGNLGLWVDLVRVPPSATWEHRHADRLALAETWVGAPDATEDAGLNPGSAGTVFVDGRVVATWSRRDGRTVVELLEDVSSADRRSIEAEREALDAFCA